jgi:hypothetical protein
MAPAAALGKPGIASVLREHEQSIDYWDVRATITKENCSYHR